VMGGGGRRRKKGRAPRWCSPLIAARGVGSRRPGGGNRGWQNGDGSEPVGAGKAVADAV
jgi:hypothetical protein